MSRSELEKLPTKRLLAKLRTLQNCEQSKELSDWENDEIDLHSEIILFKEDPKWVAQFNLIKNILGDREHIEKD